MGFPLLVSVDRMHIFILLQQKVLDTGVKLRMEQAGIDQ